MDHVPADRWGPYFREGNRPTMRMCTQLFSRVPAAVTWFPAVYAAGWKASDLVGPPRLGSRGQVVILKTLENSLMHCCAALDYARWALLRLEGELQM